MMWVVKKQFLRHATTSRVIVAVLLVAFVLIGGVAVVYAQGAGAPVPGATPTVGTGASGAGGGFSYSGSGGASSGSGPSGWSITGITTGVVTFIGESMGYIFGWIASVLFGIGGYLVQLALDVNKDILASPTVQLGWQIVLNIANLGFVLAIIVIAFATIFRLESYGMKKTLGRLIAAALLVNFSLVIAGVFINISDVFTEYLKDRATLSGPGSFQEAFASIFKVQLLLNADAVTGAASNVNVPGLAAHFGAGALSGLASIFFVAIFTFLGALALLATAIMLFVRYVILGILLILAPMVWLLWIFPATQSHWKKWWTTFFEWVFFPPLVLFFLYLSVLAMQGHASYYDELTRNATARHPTTIYSGLSTIGNLVIVLGLVFGGLITAKKLSGSGGAMMYGWAEGVGRGARGLAAGWAKDKGTGILNKPRGAPGQQKSFTQKMAEWSVRHPVASRWTGAGLAIQGVAGIAAAGGEDLVKKAMAAAAKRSVNENIAKLGYASAPERQGIWASLQEKDLLDKVPNLESFVHKRYKDEAARYGQGSTFDKIEKSFGMNVEMREALRAGRTEDFFNEGTKFFAKFSKKDWALPQYNEIFGTERTHGLSGGEHRARKEGFTHSVIMNNPGDVKKILVNLQPKNFQAGYDLIDRVGSDVGNTHPERGRQVRENLRNIQANRLRGELYDDTPPTTAPTPPAPEPTPPTTAPRT